MWKVRVCPPLLVYKYKKRGGSGGGLPPQPYGRAAENFGDLVLCSYQKCTKTCVPAECNFTFLHNKNYENNIKNREYSSQKFIKIAFEIIPHKCWIIAPQAIFFLYTPYYRIRNFFGGLCQMPWGISNIQIWGVSLTPPWLSQNFGHLLGNRSKFTWVPGYRVGRYPVGSSIKFGFDHNRKELGDLIIITGKTSNNSFFFFTKKKQRKKKKSRISWGIPNV